MELDPEDKLYIEKVESALTTFLAKDKILVAYKTREESLSHRIGCYLRDEFEGKNGSEYCKVDCEYDKFGEIGKGIGSKGIRPDIIVHKRGNQSNNLIVIEVKKRETPLDWDERKLKWMTSQRGKYHYKLGLFLGFTKINDSKASITKIWYKDHNIVEKTVKRFDI
jgi:hypothetical protein